MKSARALAHMQQHPQFRLALEVVETLQKHGAKAYLAGGCVRDAILGRSLHDFDIATSALPADVESWFEKTIPIGKEFGCVRVVLSDIPFEVTTFRSEGAYLDGRRPSSVRFEGASEDMKRRDFTVNALLLDPVSGELLDEHGGQQDLEQGIIRCVGNPEERFQEDRLRVLRALRFASVLGFGIEEKTFEAMLALPVMDCSRERVWAELDRFLAGPHLSRVLPLVLEKSLWGKILGLADEELPRSSVFWQVLASVESQSWSQPLRRLMLFIPLVQGQVRSQAKSGAALFGDTKQSDWNQAEDGGREGPWRRASEQVLQSWPIEKQIRKDLQSALRAPGALERPPIGAQVLDQRVGQWVEWGLTPGGAVGREFFRLMMAEEILPLPLFVRDRLQEIEALCVRWTSLPMRKVVALDLWQYRGAELGVWLQSLYWLQLENPNFRKMDLLAQVPSAEILRRLRTPVRLSVRVQAYMVDFLLTQILIWPAGVWYFPGEWTADISVSWGWALFALLAPIWFRFCFLWLLGATPGKLLLGLSVIGDSNLESSAVQRVQLKGVFGATQLTWMSALLRALSESLYWVVGPLYAIPILYRLDQRHLLDWMANTRVVWAHEVDLESFVAFRAPPQMTSPPSGPLRL